MSSDKIKLLDLSHTVAHGMITYTGLPGPVITEFLSREDSRGHYTGDTTFHKGFGTFPVRAFAIVER